MALISGESVLFLSLHEMSCFDGKEKKEKKNQLR